MTDGQAWRRLGIRIGIARMVAVAAAIWAAVIAARTPSVESKQESDLANVAYDDAAVSATLTPPISQFCLATGLMLAAVSAELWWAARVADIAAHSESAAHTAERWRVAQNLALSAAVVTAALAAADVTAAIGVHSTGVKAASSEGGTLENFQMIGWVVAAIVASAFTWAIPSRACRGALLLLAGGAAFAAAREIDLHERINPAGLRLTVESMQLGWLIDPQTAYQWGVRFRANWWFSARQPVLPRLLWGLIFAGICGLGVYLVRRGAGALLQRGATLNRLLPLLAVVGGLMFAGWAADDLLRYRVPLRQAQVFEETVELAAVLVYAAVIAWAARLSQLVRDPTELRPASAATPPSASRAAAASSNPE
jgi:hypothetical protein